MKSDSPAIGFGVGLILALGILLHVAGINQPFLGNFAQHQTDYATVVQRWQDTAINPALPVMRFMGRGQNRIFLGDFPLNITAAATLVKFTGIPIEAAGRGLSALFFLLSLFPFYQISFYALKNKSAAVWALFFYVFSPLTLIYGQAFLLEMTALTFAVFAYYSFLLWHRDGRTGPLLASAFFFSLMLATRIYFAPLLLPLFILFLNKQGISFAFRKENWFFAISMLALPLLWQYYASQAAQAQHDQSSLSDNLKVFVLNDPVLRRKLTELSFYEPIFNTFVTKLLNPAGLFLMVLGLLHPRAVVSKQTRFFLLTFFIAFIPLFLVAPRKFVEFDYYFLPFVPAAAILAAIACQTITEGKEKVWKVSLVIGFLILSARYSVAPIFIIPQEDRNVRLISGQVQKLTPKESRVIASHGSSTSLLYYTNRDGWAFELADKIGGVRNAEDNVGNAIERLERFRSQGAQYFVLAKREDEVINPAFFSYLRRQYPVLYESQDGLIVSLVKSPRQP